jgi:arylformamidase
MGEAIYRNYDADALYAQYNNRAMTPADELEAIKADQGRRSDAYRTAASRAELDVAYGPHPRERLNLFLPEAENPPLLAYIHGGYWQWNDKEPFDFLAEQLVANGAAFANIEYALCPDVTMTELTEQIRRALAHLWREADRFGYDRSRIVVSGHSAGGHLTAMMMATDWPSFGDGLPADLVAAGLPVSGIYDLEAVRLIPLNEAARLDVAEARALSPMFMTPSTRAPMTVVVGGTESEEFHRQADDFARAWRDAGVTADILTVPGRDHFTVLNALAEPGHELLAAAYGLLGIEAGR